jgi:hypothetical protein
MSLLDRRQAVVNLRQLPVLLGLCERPIEGRAVDLALKIGRVAPSWIFFRHHGPLLCGIIRVVVALL